MNRQSYIDLLVQYAREYRASTPFPLGDRQLVTELEAKILATCPPGMLLTGDEVSAINSTCGGLCEYGLLVLASRLALHGVRSQNPEALRAGLCGVLCGGVENSVDSRDVWAALSIVNDCCKRLSLAFEDELAGKLHASSRGQRKLIEEWLAGDRDMRRHDLRPVGDGATLTYSGTWRTFSI